MLQGLMRTFMAPVQQAMERQVVQTFATSISNASNAMTAKGISDDATKVMQGSMTKEDFGRNLGTNLFFGVLSTGAGKIAAMPFTGTAPRETMVNLVSTTVGLFASAKPNTQ